MKGIKESKPWKIARRANDFLLRWFGFDLIIVFLLVVGIIVIINFGDRSDFDKLAVSLILWGTALSIIQYTKETHGLRLSNKRLLDSSERANNIAARPILAPRFLETNYGTANYISVNLKNVGGGVAKNIRWSIKVNKDSDSLADKNLFWRSLNEDTLPKIWPNFGYRVTMFKKMDYDNLWKTVLIVKYDWEFRNNETEVFPLDLDYYASSDLSGNLLEKLDDVWVHEKIREIAIRHVKSQINE
ncbi:MAG: hypothetical protein HYT61_02865 [Candidatus Yanofskybacteria bacterium]|nr:hypothetical protein [Candidatus Yanofskybacteria bacterium]